MGIRRALVLLFIVLIGCEEKNCNLDYFPGPPLGPADDTIYFDMSVRYLYVCSSPGSNEVFTYYVVGGCWEYTKQYSSNLNCN